MADELPVVLVVSRFGSSANQRLSHLLKLDQKGYSTYLLCEKHNKPERQILHKQTLFVRRLPHPLSIAEILIGYLLRKKFRFRIFPSPAESSFNKALFNAILGFCKRHKKKKICVIIVTPPHHLSLITSKIKSKVRNAHVIIDWQDIWSADEYYADNYISKDVIEKAERVAMASADLNIFTNHYASSYVHSLQSSTGLPITKKIFAIEHAFEGELLNFKESNKIKYGSTRHIRIGFLGSFFKPPKVPGDLILDTFSKLADQKFNFCLEVVGERAFEVNNISFQYSFPWLVSVPRLDHDLAVQRLKDCDWLLLFLADLPNCRNIMHMKLVSYVQLGIPILAIVAQDTYCAKIIDDLQVGVVVPPGPNLDRRIIDALATWKPDPNKQLRSRNELSIEYFLQKWSFILKSF